MNKRLTTSLLAVAVAVAALAVAAGVATASSSARKVVAVPVVMHDPGCHWFMSGTTFKTRLVVHGKAAVKNLDEAALTVTGKGFSGHIKMGKTLLIAKPGLYHIVMVKQAPDDNHLVLVVK